MRKLLLTFFIMSVANISYAADWKLFKTSFITGDGYDIPFAYLDKESVTFPEKNVVQAWEQTFSRKKEHSVLSLVQIDCAGYRVRVLKAFIDDKPIKSLDTEWKYIGNDDFNEIRHEAWCKELK